MEIYVTFLALVSYCVLGYYVQCGIRKRKLSSLLSTMRSEGFCLSNRVDDLECHFSLLLDEHNHQWAIADARNQEYQIFTYDDLLEYEICEDGLCMVSGKKDMCMTKALFDYAQNANSGVATKEFPHFHRNVTLHITVQHQAERLEYNIVLMKNFKDCNSMVYQEAHQKGCEFMMLLASI